MKSFNVEELLKTARERTGLEDFGPSDFIEGLTVLVDSLNTQSVISDQRWDDAHERLLRLLLNRLWFAHDLTKHPEILDEQIDSPVVIVSLPRTGSTKLHRMLAASGDFQYLTMWKTHHFARIPGERDAGVARRIQQTRELERWMSWASPDILSGHPMFTDQAEEDQWLLEASFRQAMLVPVYGAPDYGAWLMRSSLQPAFDYLRAQLQYLQWQFEPTSAKPWLLKSPPHLGNEQYLLDAFKAPRLIVTHRNPVECMPSTVTMARQMSMMYTAGADPREIGPGIVGMISHMASQHLRWRAANPDVPVLDLSFRELTSNAVDTVQKVYEFLGMHLSADAHTAMQVWERNNAQHKHGRNVYSLESVGLTDAQIRTAFAPYIERYADYL